MATSKSGHAPLSAYVLHSWDWSETSLIVDLFTRERGRVVIVAKGAKRPTSNFRPVLLPFQRINVSLGKAPADEAAEIHTLRSAEWAGGVPVVAGAALFAGFYANELLIKLLPRQDPHARLFDAYADTLAALTEEASALRAFELMLLRELGVLPELAMQTLTQQPLADAGRYTLRPEAGLTAAPDGIEGRHWRALEAALAAAHPAALRAACRPVAAALRAPLLALVHEQLGHDRLRTREVMQGLRKFGEAA